MEEDLDEKSRRVRELLSNFYKSDDSDSSELDDGVNHRRDTLLQIDTKAFEPDRYMQSLLRKTNLTNLLKKHVEMAAEIRNLDSDMQMLVYENYNKFISATETIKVMKDNVSGMESNMQQLLEKVTDLRSKSGGINASLYERREKIEELNGTRSLLRKVQFVFDLPKRLRNCLKTEDYAYAVKAYVGALPVLKGYGSSSFLSCKTESEEIIAVIVKRLQERVLNNSEELEKRAQAVTLLQSLHIPVDSLMNEFLAFNMDQLLVDLQSASRAKNFIHEFARAASTFRSLFPMGESRLSEAAKVLVGKYSMTVQKSLQADTGTLSSKHLVESIRMLSADVAKMHEAMPEAGFYESAAQSVESSVRNHVDQQFKALYDRVAVVLAQICTLPSATGYHSEQQKHLLLGLENVQQVIVNGGLHVLKELAHLLDDSVDLLVTWKDTFIDLVHGGFQDFFVYLLDHFLSLSSATSSDPEPKDGGESQSPVARGTAPRSGFVLLLSRLSTFIEQEAVPRITEAVGNSFIGGSMADRPAFVPSEICRSFRAAGETLMHTYIDVQSRKLSAIICKSITTPNWLQYKEPRDVRMFTNLVLDEVKEMVGDVKQILAPGKTHHRRSDSAGSSGSARSNTTMRGTNMVHRGGGKNRLLERDVARLFNQRVEIFTKPEPTQASVISLVIKIALKSFQEYVRLETFGRCGFQQIQLDAQYLRDPLREFMDDENVVDFLLDEVCAAAAERCVDPVPLDQAVIDKIIHAKRQKKLEEQFSFR